LSAFASLTAKAASSRAGSSSGPTARKGTWRWFDPWHVPDFDEPEAWFELERIKDGWKVLDQVPTPSWGAVITAPPQTYRRKRRGFPDLEGDQARKGGGSPTLRRLR
jgi:hypothetical protein